MRYYDDDDDENSDIVSETGSLQPEDIIQLFHEIKDNVSDPWFLCKLQSFHLNDFFDDIATFENIKYDKKFIDEYHVFLQTSLHTISYFIHHNDIESTLRIQDKWYNFCFKYTAKY